MNAVPTPYDITALPYSPFSPSIYAWLILLIFTISVLLFVKLRRTKVAYDKNFNRIKALEVIKNIKSTPLTISNDLLKSSRALRRYYRSAYSLDIDSLSEQELADLYQETTQLKQREIIDVLRSLETLKFSPSPQVEALTPILIRAETLLLSTEES